MKPARSTPTPTPTPAASARGRRARITRRTHETDVDVRLNLDGRGRYEITTGIRFLDHMLELVARHGVFDLSLVTRGDLDVDNEFHFNSGCRTGRPLRKPVAAHFQAGSFETWVVGVHLKSKLGGSCSDRIRTRQSAKDAGTGK